MFDVNQAADIDLIDLLALINLRVLYLKFLSSLPFSIWMMIKEVVHFRIGALTVSGVSLTLRCECIQSISNIIICSA